MTILLTGGAGFIGSACLARFLRDGREVVVVDSFEPTLYRRELKERQLEWAGRFGEFDFVEGDVRDGQLLGRLFEQHDISAVLHIAAVAGVRPSIEQPDLYFDINVTGAARVLKVARGHGVSRFVLASSSSVYGGNEKTPFAEGDPVDRLISPYAASKLAMESLARTDHHLHGGDMTCLRFFTVYGPRQRPQMAIHKFMRRLANGQPIPMFGDGTSGRDYTYIDDIVDGVMRAIDHLDGFGIYNLGGDQVIRLGELIDAIAAVVGVEPDVNQLAMQPGDVSLTNADISKARAELGYEPQVGLTEGLERMWEWFRVG